MLYYAIKQVTFVIVLGISCLYARPVLILVPSEAGVAARFAEQRLVVDDFYSVLSSAPVINDSDGVPLQCHLIGPPTER